MRDLFMTLVLGAWNMGSVVLLWALGVFERGSPVGPYLPILLILILIANVPLANWALYVGDGRNGLPGRSTRRR